MKKIYFQAVSNSSWANYGYLAVFNPIDDFVKDELRKLNARFGIGVINFGIPTENEEKEEWEILFPAKRREDIDISMLDELVELNPGFKELIESIVAGANDSNEHNGYDKYLEHEEEVQDHIQTHKIIRDQ